MVFLNKVDVVEDEELLELVEMELRGDDFNLIQDYIVVPCISIDFYW